MNRIGLYKREEWRENRQFLRQEWYGHRQTQVGRQVLKVTWFGRLVWTRIRSV